jgi:2'-deoxynucleoside 5'-phosphate N-hydrolase
MNFYFTASISGKKNHLSNYKKIVELIKKQHTIIADHILNTTEEQIQHETIEERHTFHKQLDQWIQSADAVVAEITFPSISVGFEISRALEKGKPVLAIYSEGLPPSLLPELYSDHLIIEKYTPETVSEILQNFVQYVDSKHDTRFTFFLPQLLSIKLSQVTQKKGIPKSVFIRQLLEKELASV